MGMYDYLEIPHGLFGEFGKAVNFPYGEELQVKIDCDMRKYKITPQGFLLQNKLPQRGNGEFVAAVFPDRSNMFNRVDAIVSCDDRMSWDVSMIFEGHRLLKAKITKSWGLRAENSRSVGPFRFIRIHNTMVGLAADPEPSIYFQDDDVTPEAEIILPNGDIHTFAMSGITIDEMAILCSRYFGGVGPVVNIDKRTKAEREQAIDEFTGGLALPSLRQMWPKEVIETAIQSPILEEEEIM